MYVAWTHTTCGHRNPRAVVDVCDRCGQRPTSIPEVRQHQDTEPVDVRPPLTECRELPAEPWADAPDELVRERMRGRPVR